MKRGAADSPRLNAPAAIRNVANARNLRAPQLSIEALKGMLQESGGEGPHPKVRAPRARIGLRMRERMRARSIASCTKAWVRNMTSHNVRLLARSARRGSSGTAHRFYGARDCTAISDKNRTGHPVSERVRLFAVGALRCAMPPRGALLAFGEGSRSGLIATSHVASGPPVISGATT